ncbi:GerMN domain-containing protein [Streptomyces spectabilis]|uniref:GerMN domain-containing protein n=1 Tax=Streptomyces spectabilis TaxID=68270 RepID=A0A516RIB1_STRST|nr:GerMN domain-containing protein [Streptomyces spectabilis]QDQ15392.1 GerMN domain-containing protein [Streptomyces spectabilis]
MRRPAALALLLAAALTACGIDDTGPDPAGPAASGVPRAHDRAAPAVHVYFYSATGLERVSRLYRGPDARQWAIDELVRGPDAAERARGLISFLPSVGAGPTLTLGAHGTADLHLPPDWEPGRTALRQLVCTATDGSRATEVRLHRANGGPPSTERCAH